MFTSFLGAAGYGGTANVRYLAHEAREASYLDRVMGRHQVVVPTVPTPLTDQSSLYLDKLMYLHDEVSLGRLDNAKLLYRNEPLQHQIALEQRSYPYTKSRLYATDALRNVHTHLTGANHLIPQVQVTNIEHSMDDRFKGLHGEAIHAQAGTLGINQTT